VFNISLTSTRDSSTSSEADRPRDAVKEQAQPTRADSALALTLR
jgi:hypothetical protein